jgi:hypothetical protein
MDVLCGQQLGWWVPSEPNSDQRRGTVGSASLDLSGWLRCKRQSKNVTSNPGREEVYEQHWTIAVENIGDARCKSRPEAQNKQHGYVMWPVSALQEQATWCSTNDLKIKGTKEEENKGDKRRRTSHAFLIVLKKRRQRKRDNRRRNMFF